MGGTFEREVFVYRKNAIFARKFECALKISVQMKKGIRELSEYFE